MGAAKRPRIGLLGGSFDPPHLAHLALGRVALSQLTLDELRWLPAGADVLCLAEGEWPARLHDVDELEEQLMHLHTSEQAKGLHS